MKQLNSLCALVTLVYVSSVAPMELKKSRHNTYFLDKYVVPKSITNEGILSVRVLEIPKPFVNNNRIEADIIIAQDSFTGNGYCTANILTITSGCELFTCGPLNVKKLIIENPITTIRFSLAAITIEALYKKETYMGAISSFVNKNGAGELHITDYSDIDGGDIKSPRAKTYEFKGASEAVHDAFNTGIEQSASLKDLLAYLNQKLPPQKIVQPTFFERLSKSMGLF